MKKNIKWQGQYYRVAEDFLKLELGDVPIFYIEVRSRFLFWTWWETHTYEYYTTQWDSEFELKDAIKRAQDLDHERCYGYNK